MGSGFSKRSSKDEGYSRLLIEKDGHFAADLRSYEVACQLNPKLRNFDKSIKNRTNDAIKSLSGGTGVPSLSFDSLKEVTGCLFQTNQDVANVILECKEDIWKNQELFELVKEYFDNSLQTLDFYTALEKCVKRARDSRLVIQVALDKFEEELDKGGVDGNVYNKTSKELEQFEAMRNPFTEEFLAIFRSIYKKQDSMLKKLCVKREKLDKKMKSLEVWQTVSNVLFVAVFTSVLILSVVAVAIAAPPLVSALVNALTIAMGSTGKWLDSLWAGYTKELVGQKEIISSMKDATYIAIQDLDNIRVLIEKLDLEIKSLLENVGLDIKEPDYVKITIDEIKMKLNSFMDTIEELSDHAGKCSREIRRARTVVSQRIINYTSSST